MQAEKDAAAKREIELKLKAEAAEREKLEAVQKAEDDKQQAIDDERERVEQVKRDAEVVERQVKQAEERKAANRNHQKKINREALVCFAENDIINGEQIITLIAQGKIKNVTINY